MHRARVLVVLFVLLWAAVLAPPPAAAAPSFSRTGSPAAPLASSSWDPWSVLRQWFGSVRVDSGCSMDPYGQCAAAALGAGHPAARAPEPRPSSRPAAGRSRFRVECGGSMDPYGQCASAAPGSRAGHGM